MLRVKRIYDPAEPGDGRRYLVDRVWPRGVSKEKAGLDGWLKDLAPSTPLRQWFGHDPDRWEEFQRRYREELASPEAVMLAQRLLAESAQASVTLLFAASDAEHNNAVALKSFLEGRTG